MTTTGVAGTAVLHILRVRGASTAEQLERAIGTPVSGQLASLLGDGLVAADGSAPRRWRLTDAGRSAHDAALAEARTRDLGPLRALLERLLTMDMRVKQLCTRWQETDPADGAARWDVLADLDDVAGVIRSALLDCGAEHSRFRAYARRMDEAVARARAGQGQYVAGPLVDSFHTVWFELHEDLLLSAGIPR